MTPRGGMRTASVPDVRRKESRLTEPSQSADLQARSLTSPSFARAAKGKTIVERRLQAEVTLQRTSLREQTKQICKLDQSALLLGNTSAKRGTP